MQTSPPVAIVGMSALFAGSEDVVGFWRDVVSATDRLSDVPPHHWLIEDYYDPDPSAPDMTYAKRGGFLKGVPFDSMEFGIPPRAIPATDSAQLLALIAAKRVLGDAARFREGDFDHERTSVILGVASATELVVQMGSRLQHPIWRKALRDAGLPETKVDEVVKRIGDHYQPWQESTFPGLLGNVVAGRIANRLDLGGSNFVTDAACASSISALQAGLSELYLGDSDMVIAGGVDALNDILMYMCFSKTPAFSPTGDCRPFSEEADGTLIGEGVGMLALRRLEDAERDGDPIYAVIRGLGASSDGRGTSVYAPKPAGQAKALRRAYQRAGYSPATVELVEGHGTATKAGDAAEVRGLKSVFGPADPAGESWCALGSVKSQIGHTKAAAGSAGLIKVALALRHGILPPTLKVSKPNPQLGLEGGPFYINTEARPWIRGAAHPRRASVSSFGFGGSNFHVALEEYVGSGRKADKLRAWPDELVALSADSREALAARLGTVAEEVEGGVPLARIAASAGAGFDARADARVTLVASDLEELAEKVAKATAALRADAADALPDADIAFGTGPVREGKLAFLFPGQGSQYVGMGSAAAMVFENARAVWDVAADVPELSEAPLHRAVFPPPAFTDEERAAQQARVTEMDTAQPAIAAVSLGYLALMRALGVRPDAAAGHSFGEVTALAAAGRLDEAALLTIARTRGRLMAEAAADRAGAMLAVSADAAAVTELVAGREDVVVANDNAPSEVVVAGPVPAIEALQAELKDQGVSSVRLPVASAFHSEIVAGSCEPFHAYLEGTEWSEAELDVYANATAAPYPADPAQARRLLADQLASRVRFREMIESMHEAGVTRFVEVGPGRVLTKLVGRCLGDRPHLAVALDDKRGSGLRAFWRGVGRLAADGVPVRLSELAAGYRLPPEPAPAKPHQILVTGSNHDKPYPPTEGAAGLPAPNPELVEPAPVSSPSPPANGAGVMTPPVAPPRVPPRPEESHPVSQPSENAPPRATPSSTARPAATEIHRATLEAHRRYQELMAESHQAFLDVAAAALGGMRAGAAPAKGAPSVGAEARAATDAWVATPPDAGQAPSATPASEAASPEALRDTGAGPLAATEVGTTGDVIAAPSDSRHAAEEVDATALALEVVSEKTGYPVEMLDLDMEMEAGLGIDSIKQVEILSELQERLPGMPAIEPSELAELRTLRDVADKLQSAGAAVRHDSARSPGPEASPTSEAEVPTSSAPAPGAPYPGAADGAGRSTAESGAAPVDTTALALEVVSEKTGYPVEMLDLDMEMEAGLGIDSIKQVEILSELQERLPDMPAIEPSELAELRTLRDVADKLQAREGTPVATSPADEVPALGASDAGGAPSGRPSPTSDDMVGSPGDVGSGVDTTALALEVVAEKTGYPVEMLDLDMEMEAGLGIDSIKQVEILSELQERLPDMPAIEPSELAELRTLRDVADKLSGGRERSPSPEANEALEQEAPAELDSGRGEVRPTPLTGVAPTSIPGAVPGALAATDAAVAAFVPRLVPELRPGFGLAALSRGLTVAITNELPALAGALASGLGARGVRAEVVDEVGDSSAAVISLAGLIGGALGPDASTAIHQSVIAAARNVAGHPDPSDRLFVTIQSTGGDFGLSSDPGQAAWLGGLAGVVKTAAREWPGASLKAIDVESPSDAVDEILDELFHGGPALEVGIAADGSRGVVRIEPMPEAKGSSRALDAGSVVVVSGGARGVTASSVARLAEAWGLRLALLGRSQLGEWPAGVPLSTDPVELIAALAAAAKGRGEDVDLSSIQKTAHGLAASAEVRLSLADLDARGIETLYLSADVTDPAQVALALDHIRETWGPISGIVHGAGVLRDKAIADVTPDRVREVFAPKVSGLATLLAATAEDPLEVIALFSSIAARSGNAGQVAYAAANEVLNKVAAAEAARRGGDCRVRSYNWGPWAGGMVDAGLAAHFEKQGIALLSIEAGTEFFVRELGSVGLGVERVVLAAPSFPGGTHRLTIVAAEERSETGERTADGFAPALVADLAMRLGHALKPVHTMRTYLEDFVIARLNPDASGSAGGGVHVVDIVPVEADEPGYRMVFRDAEGRAHHETLVRYSESGAEPPPSVPSGGLEPWPIEVRTAYETILKRFVGSRSIEELEGVSDEGGVALIRSGSGLGWPPRFALGLDPAMLEGLMQLGALWTHHTSGAAQSLARMGSIVVHHLEAIPDRLRSAFRARPTATGTLFDFVLATEDGDLVAEIREVEFDAAGA